VNLRDRIDGAGARLWSIYRSWWYWLGLTGLLLVGWWIGWAMPWLPEWVQTVIGVAMGTGFAVWWLVRAEGKGDE
jgi:hypothetical protein